MAAWTTRSWKDSWSGCATSPSGIQTPAGFPFLVYSFLDSCCRFIYRWCMDTGMGGRGEFDSGVYCESGVTSTCRWTRAWAKQHATAPEELLRDSPNPPTGFLGNPRGPPNVQRKRRSRLPLALSRINRDAEWIRWSNSPASTHHELCCTRRQMICHMRQSADMSFF
jgi:hypothetical protein